MYTDLDNFSLLIMILCIIYLAHGIYENLVMKRISKYGLDAFLLWWGKMLDPKQVKVVRKSPHLIFRSGILQLLMALPGLYMVLATLLSR